MQSISSPPYVVVAPFLSSMNSARAESLYLALGISRIHSTHESLSYLEYDQISDLSARLIQSRSHPKLGNFNFSARNTPAAPKSLNPIPPPQTPSNRRTHGNIIHTLPKSMQTTADFNLTITKFNKDVIGKTGGCISRR
jgi:hypothetical protein